jgi:GT2 family glycosyltransferase
MNTTNDGAKSISIVIPNYNGSRLLKENLPYVTKAVDCYAGCAEIIVVDDASQDRSIEYLEEHFPEIRTIRIDTNIGFARACETGIRAARHDIILLLNTDVRVTENFINPLVAHFSDTSVFVVSSMSFRGDSSAPLESVKIPIFRRGYLKFMDTPDPDVLLEANGDGSPPIYTFYAVGAHCAIDRKKYLSLGGFDSLFHPYYWEDVDLCYRAWKMGWKSIVEPKSVVYHMLSGPIRSATRSSDIANIIRRNRFLFVWKNITSTRYFYFSHLIPVLLRSLLGVFVVDVRFYRALFSALSRLTLAREHRRQERQRTRQLSDEEIFELTGSLLNGHSMGKKRTASRVLQQ